jgi:predicted dehydrogenase
VSARTANFAGHPGIEDVAVATLAFASGATASLVSVWHQVLARPSTRWLEVLCEHGVVAAPDEYLAPLHLTTDAGLEEIAVAAAPWTAELPSDDRWRAALTVYAPQSRSFLDAVAARREPAPGLDVAVQAHRLADAVYRSAAAGGMPVEPGPALSPERNEREDRR